MPLNCMRLPNRKPGKYTFAQFDPTMTAEKLQALKDKLDKVKAALPQAIQETQQYGENGDFSENAEYQIAKGRLRGLNRTVTELLYQINRAVLIPTATDTTTVQLGHTVTIATAGTEKTFTILGPVETNPAAGIVSHRSPLGAALLRHKVGDTVTVKAGNREIEYIIVKIE